MFEWFRLNGCHHLGTTNFKCGPVGGGPVGGQFGMNMMMSHCGSSMWYGIRVKQPSTHSFDILMILKIATKTHVVKMLFICKPVN